MVAGYTQYATRGFDDRDYSKQEDMSIMLCAYPYSNEKEKKNRRQEYLKINNKFLKQKRKRRFK